MRENMDQKNSEYGRFMQQLHRHGIITSIYSFIIYTLLYFYYVYNFIIITSIYNFIITEARVL